MTFFIILIVAALAMFAFGYLTSFTMDSGPEWLTIGCIWLYYLSWIIIAVTAVILIVKGAGISFVISVGS